MFNLDLLKVKLTVQQFKELWLNTKPQNARALFGKLPAYIFAKCPFCSAYNVEHINTYSSEGYALGYGKNIHGPEGVVTHCSHFVCVHAFYNFMGFETQNLSIQGSFAPEVPFVLGEVLENATCQAVIHALPVCNIENDFFVPRFMVFLVSYFSENAQLGYEAIITSVAKRRNIEVPYNSDFRLPMSNEEHWWNLAHWVETGLLHWLKIDTNEVHLYTKDLQTFPYKNIIGRRTPIMVSRLRQRPKPTSW